MATLTENFTEQFWCVFCSNEITNKVYCVGCNEYKGAITLEEFIEINGHAPIGIKASA
jgi:hypothetical protein